MDGLFATFALNIVWFSRCLSLVGTYFCYWFWQILVSIVAFEDLLVLCLREIQFSFFSYSSRFTAKCTITVQNIKKNAP